MIHKILLKTGIDFCHKLPNKEFLSFVYYVAGFWGGQGSISERNQGVTYEGRGERQALRNIFYRSV